RQIDGAPLCQVGIIFSVAHGHSFARNVFEGSPGAQAGIRPGDEILSVAGAPVEPVNSFWHCGRRLKVSVRRTAAREPFEIELTPKKESLPRSLLRATEASSQTIEVKGHKIGYFRLWAGTHELFLKALQGAVRTLRGTDAFILDLRDGFGGAWYEHI